MLLLLLLLLHRYLGVHPVSLVSLFEPPGGDRAFECSWAAEAALTLLIWGEVGLALALGGVCVHELLNDEFNPV